MSLGLMKRGTQQEVGPQGNRSQILGESSRYRTKKLRRQRGLYSCEETGHHSHLSPSICGSVQTGLQRPELMWQMLADQDYSPDRGKWQDLLLNWSQKNFQTGQQAYSPAIKMSIWNMLNLQCHYRHNPGNPALNRLCLKSLSPKFPPSSSYFSFHGIPFDITL